MFPTPSTVMLFWLLRWPFTTWLVALRLVLMLKVSGLVTVTPGTSVSSSI